MSDDIFTIAECDHARLPGYIRCVHFDDVRIAEFRSFGMWFMSYSKGEYEQTENHYLRSILTNEEVTPEKAERIWQALIAKAEQGIPPIVPGMIWEVPIA